jgi:microcystin-dependent protein
MDSVYLGTICNFGFPFNPQGFLKCNGALLPVSQNNALFALLSTTYGGDGRTTFGLPNLQGRVGVSQGTDPQSGNNYQMGQSSGSTTVTLTQQNLPTHTHQATFSPGGASAVSINLSLDDATAATPIAGGYLATTVASGGVQDKPEYIYRADAGTKGTVALGGVSVAGGGGAVTVQNSGSSSPVSLMQPFVVTSFCICSQGLFPARN